MSSRTEDQTNEGWSTPSLYSGRGAMQPRTFTEADPLANWMLPGLDEDGPSERSGWSPTTYVGGTPHGRRRGAAEGPDEGVRPADSVPLDDDAGLSDDAGPADDAVPLDDSPAGFGPEAPAAAEAAERDAVVASGDDDRSTRGLLAHSRTMAVASLTSRITGFLRSSMLAAALGTGLVGDAYNVANNFPNMVYELLLGGVLSSVLIPLLVHAQEKDEDDGVAYAQRLISLATAALGLVTLLAVAAAPLIAGAFVHTGSQRSLATLFASLLLPEIFFYGLGAMFMALLNVRNSYGPGAWSSVLNNLVMMATIAVFWALPGPASLTPATITTPQILVLGIGTTLGIAAQALVLVPYLRRTGFRWRWRFRARPHEVGRMREVAVLAGWVFGYVVASQIGVTVIAKVGVASQAFTVFTFADLLLQMPYGILVVSLLTALMPRLSRAAARGQQDAVVDDLNLGARLSALALIPVTVGLFVLGPVLTVVLFGYGQTSVPEARLIGTALAASAFGLFPFAVVMLQLRVFYAMRDARTPTLINVCMVATKVAAVLICTRVFSGTHDIAIALTASTSASYVVGGIAGHLLLARRLGRLRFRSVGRAVAQIGLASLLGGAVALALVRGCTAALGTGHVGSITALVAGALGGLVIVAVVVWRLRMPELANVRGALRRG
jgi:putative peptidoglycan lipid II flippase